MTSIYLALGRGTAGVFIGFLDGSWSAGVDMSRRNFETRPVLGSSILRVEYSATVVGL